MAMEAHLNQERLIHIVHELLESSSSDDDEIEEILLQRCYYEVPKIKNYIENVVNNYTDDQFKSSFRISRQVCSMLIEDFKSKEFYRKDKYYGGRKQSPPNNYILAFLWFAANKCCLRDVSERFGIRQTTCYRNIMKVMDYLVALAPKCIKFPKTLEEKETAAYEFNKISGIPGILGCVDGTYINIRTPAHKIRSTYVNRHDTPAITLQGICDHQRKFVDVFTGAPGKIHDSRIFELSFISKDLPAICNKDYHIIGDNAYPLREYLLTPYKDYGNLTDSQRNYNFKFCQTRILIENTFGILKGRFRQLCNLDFQKVDKITKFLIFCCVLHNLCIDYNDFIEPEMEDLIDEDDMPFRREHERNELLKRLGEIKRNEICTMLND